MGRGREGGSEPYNISKWCTWFFVTSHSFGIQMRDHMIGNVTIIVDVGVVLS